MTPHDAKLGCQACAAPLDLADGARAGGALRCRFCGAWTRPAGAPTLEGLRAPVERPRSIRVEDDGRGVRIVRRWFSPAYFVLLLFCVLWNGILVVFYRAIVASGAPGFVALFPIVHVAVGLGLTYFTIAGFVNRTVVTVEPGRTLTIRHGPLPWPGARDLDPDDLAQLFVVSTRKPDDERSRSPAYALAALTRDGRRLTLLRDVGLPVEDALFVEQELERRLRIHDVPVRGELDRAP